MQVKKIAKRVVQVLTSAGFRKFQAALVTAGGIFAAAAADGTMTTVEWVQVGLALLGAGGVYTVENASEVPSGS